MGCSACVKSLGPSSGGGECGFGCSMGCSCWKKSSNEEESVRRRKRCSGACCIPCAKPTCDSYREDKGKCCSGCGSGKFCSGCGSGKCCSGCGLGKCCSGCGSGKCCSGSGSGKCGLSCFRCKKPSTSCWKSLFCCSKSPKMCCRSKSPETDGPSRKRGKCGACFSCCTKPLKAEESSRKGGKCASWFSCRSCCSKSSKLDESGGGGEEKAPAKGCFRCVKSSAGGGCFSCCKPSKTTTTCCCRRARAAENDSSSTKRRCARITGCFSCCSKPSCKMKSKCSRRPCWKRKEKKKPNHLASLVKSISFKSDEGGKQRSAVEEILRIGNGNIAARVFTYRQLVTATQNFNPDCLLGSGGFGRVYKGQLDGTKEVVAVKQLDRQGHQGNREFLIEVLMLSLLDHRNLVNLLGYCADGDERILVYEFMPLGSLQDHLHDRKPNIKPLDWNTRMKIAAGAAKGLEHLHDIANPPVIYRDLKASNILLDKDFTPKLSDFGLAKLGPVGEQKHISTRVMGTYGYCAPEYARTGKLTKMSDVYSFGVLLLELITGRKPMDKSRPPKEQVLSEWAAPLFTDKKRFLEIADPLLEGKFPVRAMYQALAIASVCLTENASTRPVVRDIVTALEFLAGQNGNVRAEEPEGATPPLPPEPEIPKTGSGSDGKRLLRSQSNNDWQSCSTVNEEEIKIDADLT